MCFLFIQQACIEHFASVLALSYIEIAKVNEGKCFVTCLMS